MTKKSKFKIIMLVVFLIICVTIGILVYKGFITIHINTNPSTTRQKMRPNGTPPAGNPPSGTPPTDSPGATSSNSNSSKNT